MVSRNGQTICLTVEGVGDRAVEYSSGATVADFALALSEQQSTEPRTFRVARTSTVLPPALPVEAADLRFGDTVRLVVIDCDAGIDERLVASSSATLDMLSGPSAGTSFLLKAGLNTLGRVSTNDVTIVDPSISRHHATVTVSGASVVLEDNGSTNGVTVAGQRITTPTHIRSGEQIKLGQSEAVLTHHAVPAGDPDRSHLEIPAPAVARYEGRIVSLPTPPLLADGGARRAARLPLGRSQQRQELDRFHATLDTVIGQLEQEQQIEQATRLIESPSFAEIQAALVSRTSLWARMAGQDRGPEARVGLGLVPSRIRFESLAGGPQDLRAKLASTVERFSSVGGAPVTVDLGELGSLGVQGPIEQARALAYSLVGQLSASYGPDQLGIVTRPGERRSQWDWLKWLPHVDFVGSASGLGDGDFVSWIGALLDDGRPAGSGPARRPATILIVVDDDRPLPSALRSRLIEDGPDLGIHTMLLADETRGFDSILGATIRVADETASIIRQDQDPILGVAVESCTLTEVESVARFLAAVAYQREEVEPVEEPADPGSDESAGPDRGAVMAQPFLLGRPASAVPAQLERRIAPVPSPALTPPPATDAPPASETPAAADTVPPPPPLQFPGSPSRPRPPQSHIPPPPALVPPQAPSKPQPPQPPAAPGSATELAAGSAMSSDPPAAEPPEPSQDLAALPHPEDDSRLVLGTVELERGQSPAVFALNLPRDRSLGLTGGPGSGKTSALRSVAAAAGMLRVEPGRIPTVYYLDVSGNLEDIRVLPHVSGAAKNDIVGFRSLINTIEQLVSTREDAFGDADAETLEDYRRARPDEEIRRVIILVNDIGAVGELLDSLHPGRWSELAAKIVNDGGRLGIHLVFSAADQSGIDEELVPKIGRWMTLGAPDADGNAGRPGQAVVGKGRVRFATIDGRPPEAEVSDLAG